MTSQKISEFNVSTSLTDSDLFTFVVNGTNKNIAYSNFKLGLGVTGTLAQVGNLTATPVLYTSGTDYFIRNLESGPGILASISAFNGVGLKWNVGQNEVGFPLVSGLANPKPVISSLINGTGISIAQGTDSLTISATGVTTPTHTVIINQESDFPIQDGTTITLSAQTRYVIGDDISSAKYFVCEDGFVFTSENILGVTYTYTGTGDMFTSTLAGGTVENIQLNAPNCSQVFNMSDTSITKINIITGVRVANAPKWGTYTGFSTTETDNCALSSGDDGLTIAGTGQLITSINRFAVISSSATCVQLDLGAAIISNAEFDNLILVAPAGGIQLKGAASSANIPSGLLGMMSNSSVLGGATAQLSGITVDDIRWDFQGNTPTHDSLPDGLMHVSGSSTETVITTLGVAVKMTNTWTNDAISMFTFVADGRITYIGERDTRLPIDVSATLLMASGGDKQAGISIAINGSVIAATTNQSTVSSSKSASVSTMWQHTFVTNDYVEVFLTNIDDTVNIIGQQAILRVN